MGVDAGGWVWVGERVGGCGCGCRGEGSDIIS